MEKSTHCTIDGCDTPVYCKRMCRKHYNQDYYRRGMGAEIAARLEAERAAHVPPTHKVCTGCGIDKPVDDYRVERRNHATGRTAKCRSCMRATYVERRDIVRAQVRRYQAANRDLIRERKRRQWAVAGEAARAQQRAYYAKNKAVRSEAAARRRTDPAYAKAARDASREWRRNNPDKTRVQGLLRQKRIREAGVIPFTVEQFEARVAYYGGRCWMCGDDYREMDHVKPVARGGATMLANLRPACTRCNAAKKAKWFGVAGLHKFIK